LSRRARSNWLARGKLSEGRTPPPRWPGRTACSRLLDSSFGRIWTRMKKHRSFHPEPQDESPWATRVGLGFQFRRDVTEEKQIRPVYDEVPLVSRASLKPVAASAERGTALPRSLNRGRTGPAESSHTISPARSLHPLPTQPSRFPAMVFDWSGPGCRRVFERSGRCQNRHRPASDS
jgi:hypothetical protein